MTYAGARTQTETEMAQALRFTLPQGQLHPAINHLDLALASRGQGAQGMDGEKFRLNIVNAIWGQDGFSFLPEYLDTLAVNYDAGVHLVDFVSQPAETREMINDWVSYKTEGKINDLLPEGFISADTRLVLTNAIYFNAAWSSVFDVNKTYDGVFSCLDGSSATVPMMNQVTSLKYTESGNYQAVELPYDGKELSMIVLLPAAGQFASVENTLTAEAVEAMVNAMQPTQVALTLPKYKVEAQFDLKATLEQMGMPIAFSGQADFSGINGSKGLFISQVVHKAYVQVTEKGTEAAAATGVGMNLTSMPISGKTMVVNRSFIFIIRDQSGSLLFAGRVLKL
jgi:serpin B